MALNKYTQVEVAALSDAELSRLASVLRFGREITWDIWSPATDRNQSGELLQFASHKGAAFTINMMCSTDAWIYSSVNTFPGQIKISGATARSETIAAVCALLAIEGRLL
jgi:hypothetical protein